MSSNVEINHYEINYIQNWKISSSAVADKCTIVSSRCDVSIKDDQPEISGKHCVLEWKNGFLFISDLDSRNELMCKWRPN